MENFNFYKLLGAGIAFSVCCCLLIVLIILKKKVVKKHEFSDVLVRNVRAPVQLFIALTALYAIFQFLQYEQILNPTIEHVYSIFVTICFGWLAIKVINLIASLLLSHFDLQQEDNYLARQVHTQVRIFRRLSVVLIIFCIIVLILISFDSVRAQGVSLFASAGLLSIIIGLAAQKTMSHFFAGIQIAIAQPVRVDDIVVVENETGTIEEIHLTYVIIKLMDLRRLIVPITYFTDHTFQNWTQKSATIIGTVTLYVDYTMPVGLIREQLSLLLEGNKLWDGKTKDVLVTNTTENTMEIRITTSSPNSAASFNLRCAIREHMIAFIQKNYSTALPKTRTEISKEIKIEDSHKRNLDSKEPE